ncbi:MAG: response regulator [Pseudomonadota bacterium]|nr:response regulator [Pseudomonadota bacterium]
MSVVNDDKAVLVSLRFLFQSAGFDARLYTSGRSLLASSLKGAADCFVLDHKSRGPDGLDLARRLRRLGLRAPIVLTTGFRGVALESLTDSVDLVIPAPRVDEETIRHLTRLIEERRLRKST